MFALALILAAPPVAVGSPRGDAAIEIDGRLDEAVWQAAALNTGFVERSPNPGTAPPADTQFRVLYDDQAVYVGVRCFTLPGEVPRALELTRDSGRIWSDDAVTLKFDVALDRRSTLGFVANPAGAKIDFVALDNGATFRTEIDSVWSVATSIEPDAWVAEFRVPYSALGLAADAGDQVIGFNVTRDHNTRNATDDWSHLPPEFGPMAATHYGRLTGLRDVGTRGRPAVVIPYALVRTPGTDAWSGDDVDLRAGADLRLRLGQDAWGELTTLTDFAEVDLDDRVVNLDRFPLFLPEKRPFFLSGLQVFEFGEAGVAQPFFSRRIGLNKDAEPTLVWGGAKVYGQSGGLQYGLLDVVSGQDGINDGVGRVRHVFGGAGHLGGMVVARNGLGDGASNDYSLGLDGSVQMLDDRLVLSTYSTSAFGDASDPGFASRARLKYSGARFQPAISVRHITEDFDPAVGFVRRTDLLSFSLDAPVVTYWSAGPLTRATLASSLGTSRSASASDHRASTALASLGLTWRNGWSGAFGASYDADVVVDPFELLGQTIATDTYTGLTTDLSFSSPSTRNPTVSGQYTFVDGFFGGTRHGLGGDISAYAGPHVRLAAGANYSRVRLPDAAPDDTLALNSKLTLAASPSLFTDFVFQTDTSSDDAAVFARLRWRYLPGSDLFIVYQQQGDRDALFQRAEHALTIKLTYWADLVL